VQKEYLDYLEKIDNVIRESETIDLLLESLTGTMIEIFQCERSWIIYPCDPNTSSWQAKSDRSIQVITPKYEINIDHPMTSGTAEFFKEHLQSSEPLIHSTEQTLNVPGGANFLIENITQLSIAIQPKIGSAWLLSIEHINNKHTWNDIEQKLFKHISNRFYDALNNLLLAQDLLKSKENLNSILRKLPDLILELDLETNIISSNRLLKNRRPNIFAKSHISEALSVSQVQELDKAIQEIKNRSSEKIKFDLPVVTMDSNEIRFFSHLLMPTRKEGNIVGFILIATDITEQKRAQDALTRLNSTLEKRVSLEANINRQKDHLMFQQSRLASMGEMIGNIAHQWRQPLSSLSAIIQNIRHKAKRDKLTVDFLNKITDDALNIASQMSETIDDFRNFFEPSRSKERFNVNEALHDTLDLLKATLRNKNITIINSAKDNIDILGYRNELSQTILNIFSNAKDALIEKAEQEGNFIPVIMTEIAIAQNNRHVQMTIRDNGGGIPNEIISRIFEPYFTTKEGKKGTGIGLYMSKQIIETNMNGRLSAKNVSFDYNGEPQKGAEFVIELPLTLK